MARRLEGRIAFVTGAAQGIGAAIADACENEGATVWRTDVALRTDIEGRFLKLDVSRPDDWNSAVGDVAAKDGRLDVLVNNAGIEWVVPLKDLTLADWRRVMAINVEGVFLGCQAFEQLLAKRSCSESSASVVNISSIAGLVGYPDQSAYNTSKGAVRHLSKSLAIEWAAHGQPIRVNSVHPGCIRTPMLEAAAEGWRAAGHIGQDDPWADVAAMHPLNRVGDVNDIAMGVVYLASDEAKFVTGIELVIDGGWVAR
ncbi:MAG: hypothetical protein A3J40_05890 [Erythrobacter sp. RIFCSPHIGHO2_12_FULL_63_10]|nr:MAG: hypothetical protein A3J40_05890 [Erythrobacter sp. RIFCSPHIGHO2_12_FULL_63_10]